MKKLSLKGLFSVFTLGCFLCIFNGATAQSISRQVIGITGGNTTFSGSTISWTVGETVVAKSSSTDRRFSLTAGFQQPDLSISPQFSDSFFSINVAPNPTPDLVTITITDPLQKDLRLTLSNVQGQILIPNLLLNPWKNQVDLSAYPAGTYYLSVSNSKKKAQAYKIVKQ